MAEATQADANGDAGAAPGRSKIGIETVLAIAGALVAFGFVLPWFDPAGVGSVSGLDAAGAGGLWTGLYAIPALGLLTAVFGGLRWRASRYTGLLTAIALVVAVAQQLVVQWPWLYTIPLVVGIAAIVLGKLARGPWLNVPLGAVLLVGSIAAPLLAGERLLPDLGGETSPETTSDSEAEGASEKTGGDTPAPTGALDEPLALSVGLGVFDQLGVLPAIPLAGLWLLMPFCGVWLLWSGLRKKGRERPLVVSGCAIVALDAYLAALVAFGPTLVTSGIGLWMTAVGGGVLLFVSRPFASRSKGAKAAPEKKKAEPEKKQKAKADEPEKKKAKPEKPEKKPTAEPEKQKAKADEPDKKPKAKKTDEPEAKPAKKKPTPEQRAKLIKLAKLKKLKKLELLKARKLAEAKAAKEEAATAKAGEALEREPEPVFAADPTAPPAPENEDREALMQRMGVKAPPPPSDNELEDMLAALKKRTGGD